MRSFWLSLLIAGGIAIALRPVLNSKGEAPIFRADIEIQPLSVHHLHVDPPKPTPRPRGRTIEQILADP
jgi:hypothetical protein